MNTVTIQVCSRAETKRRFLRAFKGEPQGSFITFASYQRLFKVLSPKRWDLLKVMTGAGSMTIREAARRAKRDIKAVHGDVKALLGAGILDKTDDGKVIFPYDDVHVDFMLKAA